MALTAAVPCLLVVYPYLSWQKYHANVILPNGGYNGAYSSNQILLAGLQALPEMPNTAKAWVMSNGAMLSVDAAFTDWFGYKPDAITGVYISQLVVDVKRFEQ